MYTYIHINAYLYVYISNICTSVICISPNSKVLRPAGGGCLAPFTACFMAPFRNHEAVSVLFGVVASIIVSILVFTHVPRRPSCKGPLKPKASHTSKKVAPNHIRRLLEEAAITVHITLLIPGVTYLRPVGGMIATRVVSPALSSYLVRGSSR